MKYIFLISLMVLIAGWMFIILGLKLSIKYKKKNDYEKGKKWFAVFLIGEFLSNSWYVMIISLGLIISRFIIVNFG